MGGREDVGTVEIDKSLEPNWHDLANAVILQAVDDYRKAYTIYCRRPWDTSAKATVEEVTRFFHSQWFCALSGVDGPAVLNRITEEIDERYRREW